MTINSSLRLYFRCLLLLLFVVAGKISLAQALPSDSSNAKLIHVVVALCDNDSQGIVPVPKRIGNGDDPFHNLYWGAGYGVKTFFKRSEDWNLVASTTNVNDSLLERLVFEHKTTKSVLIAEAIRGKYIKPAIERFMRSAAGHIDEKVSWAHCEHDVQGCSVNLKNATLVAFVGHNGLMDFEVETVFAKAGHVSKDAVILSCASENYFKRHIAHAEASALLTTTNLMAPEAYTLHAAIEAWLQDMPGEAIKEAAAKAYNKYQKCGLSGARRLFSTDK